MSWDLGVDLSAQRVLGDGRPLFPEGDFVKCARPGSVDAEVRDDAGVREDFCGVEGHLVDEDGDECVPDGLAGPRGGARRRWLGRGVG